MKIKRGPFQAIALLFPLLMGLILLMPARASATGSPDSIERWNIAMTDFSAGLPLFALPPMPEMRAYAMAHIAMLNAVKSAARSSNVGSISVDAAVAAAAHDVLVVEFGKFFGSNTPFGSTYTMELAAIPDGTAKKQGVELKRGDYVIVRTGQMERCQKAGSWDGYPGGDAPGFAFETLDWIKRTELAALASDTWGCEVRPNESEEGINQPWHWITIPIMGMTMGEIFQLKELADDCAADKVYEFMFVAPAIPITGAVGSPVNPLAIK